MARRDPEIAALLDRFVTVRLVQANGLDLSLFSFDFDLTFTVFLLNADGTVYGRYGTRSDREAVKDISMEGLKRALEGALELHAAYPGNRAALAGKRAQDTRYRRPERYPQLDGYGARVDFERRPVKSCLHCHQIRAAERAALRAAKKRFPDRELFPYPMPDAIGLTLDPKERARVVAATAPFEAGDDILALDGQPILSIADVQWALHHAGDRIEALVLRRGARETVRLELPAGWRRRGDISWRTSTWDLRRMALGGMVLRREEAPRMRLRVEHVGRYGKHAVAMRAGVRKGDVVTSFAGRSDPWTESALIAWVLDHRPAGRRVNAALERGGERVDVTIRLQ